MQNAAFSDELSALAAIARDLLTHQPGDRIPTVVEYQERLGIGSGTVQARLRALANVGAIQLLARGHQGTVLLSRELADLWSLARLNPVRGVLPLPEAVEPVSLAAVLRREFQGLKIPLELLYLHGAAKRVDLVRSRGADFAVVSRPAAEATISRDAEEWLMRDFGPESYHRVDSMVVLLGPSAAADGPIVRVGVDRDSHDHSLLTRLEFPAENGYVHVPQPHVRLPSAVFEGLIDAAVWLRTTLAIPLSAVGIAVRPLQTPAAIRANEALGRAVLVARAENVELASVLRDCDLSRAPSVQGEIMKSELLPIF